LINAGEFARIKITGDAKLYEKILVPLDGSKLAEIALPYAEELGGKLGSEIILLNVRAPTDNPNEPEQRAYISKMAAMIEQNIKKSPPLPHGEKFKVISALIGSSDSLIHPDEEILDYAEKENISLIVMVTHGRTGIRRWTLGSTANKVVRASKCPVLLIRASADLPRSVHLDNILAAVDGSKPGEAVLPYIENLASKLKASIILLNVVEPPYHFTAYAGKDCYSGTGIARVPYTGEEINLLKVMAEEYVKSVSDKLDAKGINASYEVMVGSAGEEIIKAEEEMHPGMVAMSTHGHSGLGRWEHGSVADKVLHAGNAPLLLVRPRQF
jgi:nucleotide-binding universal stress UspA family protein